MRILFLATIFFLLNPGPVLSGTPELITVPSEATVMVVNENYSAARQKAIRKVFNYAVYLAVAGMISPYELDEHYDLIEQRMMSKGKDFVSSYKFLDEITDHAAGTLAVRMQVTLFLDPIRKVLLNSGVRVKRRDMPKLVIVINELNAGFISENTFMLLSSLTEEILVRNFRQRGFVVADRNDVRKARLEALVMSAIKGDQKAAAQVGRALDADMLVFGTTEVNIETVPKGENVQVTISVALRRMPDGSQILEKVETGGGLFDKVLAGSVESIQSTAHIVARDLAVAVAGKWKDIKEQFNG